MKVVVLQEDLLKKLLSVSRFVSSKAQLPVLSNILLVAEKNRLKLTATNLELGISLQIGAKIEKEGGITVPARMIVELISNLSAGQISLEEKQGQLYLSTPYFSATINGIPTSEFPPVPGTLEKTSFSISREILQILTNQVVFSAALDESRPVLTGVLLSWGESLTAVATDGFRLSLKDIAHAGPKNEGKNIKLLVPARAIDETCKVFQDGEEILVSAQEREKRLLFGGESGVLSSKLLEGEFPDYTKILPVKWAHKTTVGKEEFARAVKTAAVFAREGASVIKVGFKKDKLVVAAESKQYGSEEIFIDAKNEGDELEVAYNYRYVLEFLESISGNEVSLETEGATSPGVLQDTKDPTYKHLIMPVRIQN